MMESDVRERTENNPPKSVSSEKPDMPADGTVDAPNPVLCPFVCGLCTEKFDKVSKFYAHLKTHSNFESIAKSSEKKSEMLEALNVSGKVDDHVFTCGICNVDFPSMSLLHQHMVEEEKISSYNYCEKDHTARTNTPDAEKKETETPVKRGRGRPRKTVPSAPTEQLEAVKQIDEEIADPPKSRRGRKRKVVENSSGDELDETKVLKTPKKKGTADDEQLLSPRKSSRRSSARIDYKILAGYSKIESEDASTQVSKSDSDDSDFEEITPKKTKYAERKYGPKIADVTNKAKQTVSSKTNLQPKVVYLKLDGSEESPSKSRDQESDHFDQETTVVEIIDGDKNSFEDEAAAEAFLMLSNINEEKEEEPEKEADVVYVTAGSDSVVKENDPQSAAMKRSYLFSCNVCGIVLSGKALRKHKLSHLKSDVIKCNLCPKKYKSHLHLAHHTRSVHRQPKLKCPKCKKICKGKQSMERHMAMHILKKEVEEKSIDEMEWEVVVPDVGDTEEHDDLLETAYFDEADEEADCYDTVEASEVLLDDYKAGKLCKESQKAGDKRVQCGLCKHIFKHIKSFRRHMRKIHLCEKYQCKLCQGVIRTRKAFEMHMRLHKGTLKTTDTKIENAVDDEEFGNSNEDDDDDENTGEEDEKLYEDMDEQAEINEVKVLVNEATDTEDQSAEVIPTEDQPAEVIPTEDIDTKDIPSVDAEDITNGDDDDIDDSTEKVDEMKEDVDNEIKGEEIYDAGKEGKGKVFVVQVNRQGQKMHSLRCEFCPFIARCNDGLAKHQIIHSEAVNQICEFCDRVFDSIKQLERHKIEKHNVPSYTCTICGEHLKVKQSIHGHRAKHLMKTDQYYSEEVVEILQKEMAEEEKARIKEKKERPVIPAKAKGDEMVECEVCKNMVRAKRLQRHLEIHVTTKNHKCDLCGKFYKSQRYLKDHIKKTHEKGKDAVCDLCGNVYKGNINDTVKLAIYIYIYKLAEKRNCACV